jgi:ABC-type glycerol-3-phosphate transport system permease component
MEFETLIRRRDPLEHVTSTLTGVGAPSSLWRIPLHVALLVAAAVSLSPFIWLICACFKSGNDLFNFTFLPFSRHGILFSRLSLSNFTRLFQENQFGRWMLNSIFLSCAQTAMAVTLASLGGFTLAKYRFRGRKIIMAMMLGTMLLPAQVLMPSSYELMYKFGWIDSYLAILVPGSVNVFGLFLFRQAMLAVPDELLHAGRIDGCSEAYLWWEIALPLVRPMVGAFTLLSFTASWNSFLWPQIVLQNETKYTLPIGLYNLNAMPGFQADFGILMAATLLSVLPVALLFFALQRDFIAGLTAGAVKA